MRTFRQQPSSAHPASSPTLRARSRERTRDSKPERAASTAPARRRHRDLAQIKVFSDGEPAFRGPRGSAPPLPVQAKLTVGRIDDPLEQQADRVARQVMRTPVARVPSALAALPISDVRSAASTESGSVREAIRSPGQPLDASARAFFEPRFGRDFGQVRIHTGGAAARSAHDLDASAYTVGQDIVFARGRYAPQSPQGQHLVAHELTHLVQQQRGGQQLIQRAPANPGTAKPDGVAVSRVENEDGTWTALNSRGDALYTGLLGPVVDPHLPDLYSTLVVGERAKSADAKAEALKKYRDPAWDDPLSPIGPPESYDPKIYDIEVLKRKAAERKFDEYDRKEYGAHGAIYKKPGSGRIYANDLAPEDWKELSERYNIKASTDPDRVVLPTGSYAFESVYEGKLLKQVLEENKLPPEAIHHVAAQLEAETESGAYQSLAAIGAAGIGYEFESLAPPPPRIAPGRLGRAYMKLRLAIGLGGQGMERAGANPTIGAGGGAGRPVAALKLPATGEAGVPAEPVTVTNPVFPSAPSSQPPNPSPVVNVAPASPQVVAPATAAVNPKNFSMRAPPGGGDRAGMASTAKKSTPFKPSTPVVEVLPRGTVPMSAFEPPEPGHYIRRKPPSAPTQAQILARAGRTTDGRLRDANTGRALEDGEAVWGHAPNYQFKEMRDMAEKLKWTQEDFDKFFDDPNKWQVEYGPSNSGRVFDRIPRQRPIH